MNILDARTVLFSYIITNAICVVVMASLWWQNRRRSPELAFWMADFIMQFTGVLLLTMRGFLPDFFTMVLSNTLIVGGTFLLLIGLERYTNKTGLQWQNYLFMVAFILAQIFYVFIQPSMVARTINISIGIFVFCSQGAWLLLWRVKPTLRRETLGPGFVFLAFSLISLLRIIVDLTVPPENDLFKSDLYDTLAILIFQMLYISLTFSLSLMVSRRLLTSLESDIAERIQTEEALKISEEKFSIAFHNVPDAILITTLPEGKVIETNESFFHLAGYGKEESIGKTTVELNLWGDLEDRSKMMDALQKQNRVLNFETDFRKKSGRLFRGLISCELIQLQNQTYVQSIISDITERKQAEETVYRLNVELEKRVEERTRELRDAQDRLVHQEKLAVLGQLASTVGHELRNPLGIINSAVYYLKIVQANAEGKVKEYLGIIEHEVRVSEKIINDLLDFARIKSTDLEPVIVSDLIQRALERFPVPDNIEINLDLPVNLPRIYVDPRQVIQVLGNLTLNACQAMESVNVPNKVSAQLSSFRNTHKNGCLSFCASEINDMLVIKVQDTGIGIPPENINKIFEPLFTTRPKGIGLGLAVSQKLVEANNGHIDVQSEAGKGSSFSVYLPIHKEAK